MECSCILLLNIKFKNNEKALHFIHLRSFWLCSKRANKEAYFKRTSNRHQPIKKALVSDIITADSARTVEVGMFSLYSSNEIRSVEVSKIGYEDTRMCANGSTCITVMMRVKQEVVESELPAEGGCVIPIQEEVDMMDATNVNMTRHKAMSMGATMMWKTPIESNTESYSEIAENDFHIAQNEPLRAFSIDVDRASYSNVRRFINNGQLPPVNAIRIEEMINYFDYEYHAPKGKEPVRVFTEVNQCTRE